MSLLEDFRQHAVNCVGPTAAMCGCVVPGLCLSCVSLEWNPRRCNAHDRVMRNRAVQSDGVAQTAVRILPAGSQQRFPLAGSRASCLSEYLQFCTRLERSVRFCQS